MIRSAASGIVHSLPAKVRAAFVMARPVNGLVAFTAVWMGAWLGGGDFSRITPTLTAFSAAVFLILSFGNIVNDMIDLPIDRINRPERPLPSGRLDIRTAGIIAAAVSIIGIVLAFSAGTTPGIIALSSAFVLLAYSIELKNIPLVGNMAVAGLTSLTFICGGLTAGNPGGAAVPAVFAFFFTLSREIFKDIEDIAGDKYTGARTTAVSLGVKKAWFAGAAAAVTGIIYSPVPFFFEGYSAIYLILVVIGVDLIVIPTLFVNPPRKGASGAKKISTVLKLIIFTGFAAIALGRPH